MTTAAIQDGRTMDYTAGGTITNGQVIEFVDSIGIAHEAAVSGQVITLLMLGVFELDKETGVVFTQGDFLFWDGTNNRLDKTATNIPAGICWEDAATGATSAKVSINVGSPLP